ncbi:serine/threonine-protein kinase [Verrucosispora sp. SN26_14.1]|uniref:serine/threonine-protein kinase n=1 Tax=Verrucosispora sp. SN26_14.1 TaxID=2527879 RepID=UPI001F4595DF|nr:serine/threonine-protein kinase [Verrucosispora sp. SN26_14.1]
MGEGQGGAVGMPAGFGVYRVERLLGVGSFATVWLAYDPGLDARVAIKVLAENWHHDVRVRERFLDEARLLRRMEDDRLVRVRAVGELPDGRPYTVLDWADGGSLRDRLADGPLPVPTALTVLGEIAAGVAVLHRHRVVHRDLTPGNILFRSTPAGERVLIADLGLAKALAVASGLTVRAGTPGYMAPEQDDPLAVVDVRADVYALGRLGLRLLGIPPPGRPDPRDATPASDHSDLRDATPARELPRPEDPTTPSLAGGADRPHVDGTRLRLGVPPAVAQVLRRAGATRPDDRHPDAADFRSALLAATAMNDPVSDVDRRTPCAVDAGTPTAVARVGATTTGGTTAVPVAPAVSGTARPDGGHAGPVRARRRWWGGVGLVLVLVATAGAVAADATAVTRTATSGALRVDLPDGWRSAGTGWAGRYGGDGRLEPALVISPEPDRWAVDPTVPGAFLGLSASAGRRTDPAGFVAEQPHADCTPAPVRRVRRGGLDWVVARFDCARDRPVLVEAAARAPVGLLYAQVVPPPDTADAFVESLLDGVRVG